METVRTYMAVIREPGNPEVDGTKMEWFFHMPGELEEFLTTVGWKRGPRTDGGAAGVWSHHSAAPARWLEVEAL